MIDVVGVAIFSAAIIAFSFLRFSLACHIFARVSASGTTLAGAVGSGVYALDIAPGSDCSLIPRGTTATLALRIGNFPIPSSLFGFVTIPSVVVLRRLWVGGPPRLPIFQIFRPVFRIGMIAFPASLILTPIESFSVFFKVSLFSFLDKFFVVRPVRLGASDQPVAICRPILLVVFGFLFGIAKSQVGARLAIALQPVLRPFVSAKMGGRAREFLLAIKTAFQRREFWGMILHTKPPIGFRHVLGHSQCRQDTSFSPVIISQAGVILQ